MLKRGEQVQVWNRTPSKALELEQYGARAFRNVKEAVQGASYIHLTLKDDASVDEVLQTASEGFAPGAVIIDHTTTSKEGAIRRTSYWKERGFVYQHAPVFMGPPNALEGTGYMLVSGDQEIILKLEPELSIMTGKLLNLGSEEGKAAAMKLVGNAFLVCFTFGLRDTLAVAKSLGISVNDMLQLFQSWNPGAQVDARLKRMTTAIIQNPPGNWQWQERIHNCFWKQLKMVQQNWQYFRQLQPLWTNGLRKALETRTGLWCRRSLCSAFGIRYHHLNTTAFSGSAIQFKSAIQTFSPGMHIH
jgi:3-hydroxyisobutyrate dehydrogenase